MRDIGSTLLSYGNGGYVLPFEVISLVLLAALAGAIVIAKRNPPAA
jgi:NADH-quinone oxidoreductase subunit J